MGSVWVAEKVSTHQPFAVKFLKEEFLQDPAYLARFEREVAALRAIRHPNVVNIFDWSIPKDSDDPDAKPYVVMELLEGEGLDQYLRKGRVLSPEVAVSITLQILDGLAAAHNQGVIHRDLGPPNVFLSPISNDRHLVRILDFGLARPLVPDESEANITEMGILMGKPAYIAPEAFLHAEPDSRWDLFAVGMILYRMLAGRLPFREGHGHMLWGERYASRDSTEEYPSVREFSGWVPEKLALVTAKAILRQAKDRYQSAEDMQVDLLDIEDTLLTRTSRLAPTSVAGADDSSRLPDTPGPASLPLSTLRARRKRRLAAAWTAGAAVVAAVVAWIVVDLSGGDAPPPPAPASPVAFSGADAGAAEGRGPPVDEDVAADVGSGSEETVAPRDAPPPEEVVAVEPPPVDDVVIVLSGVPAGATARVCGEIAEGDPPKARRPRSEELCEITVSAEGFQPFSQAVLLRSDQVVEVRLRPVRGSGNRPRRDGGTRSDGSSGPGPAVPAFPEDLT
jgi:hypothetical protein